MVDCCGISCWGALVLPNITFRACFWASRRFVRVFPRYFFVCEFFPMCEFCNPVASTYVSPLPVFSISYTLVSCSDRTIRINTTTIMRRAVLGTRLTALAGARSLRCEQKSTMKSKRLFTSADGSGGKSGYVSIGSFHSESVEALATRPDELYTAPEIPFDCPTSDLQPPPHLSASASYDYCSDFFLDRNNWTFVNHGAFGAALRCGNIRASSWRNHLERQPLRYFDRDLLPHLAHSNRLIANFVHGKKDALALIQNATVGLNAVIGGYTRHYGPNALILYYDVSYGSVKKMVQHYSDQSGGSFVEIPFQEQHLPLDATTNTEAEAIFVSALDKAIDTLNKEGCSVENTLLVLDHTTSNTAINVPIEALSQRAKEHDMLVLVDGAHGLLAQHLDMKALEVAGVDFYVSNGHKWMAAPRGVAVLYCPNEESRESLLKIPPVISHGVDDGYLSRFLWDGCRDYAAQLSIPSILGYWDHLGADNVRRHMRKTLFEAVQILADLWHPSLSVGGSTSFEEMSAVGITAAPISMHSPMALIRLPDMICGNPFGGDGQMRTSVDAKEIQDFLFDRGVECPIKCINRVLYVRISSHIYNRREEYHRLGQVVLEFPAFK